MTRATAVYRRWMSPKDQPRGELYEELIGAKALLIQELVRDILDCLNSWYRPLGSRM